MDIFSAIQRVHDLHILIRKGQTGSPEYLAATLGISRATLYRMLDDLKSYNAPIIYSRKKKTFLYSKEFELKLTCSLRLIESEEELFCIAGKGINPSISEDNPVNSLQAGLRVSYQNQLKFIKRVFSKKNLSS